MKVVVFATIAVMSMSIEQNSYAGQEGGGGAGVVCVNYPKSKRVRLLDLAEAEEKGMKFKRSKVAVEVQVKERLKTISSYFGDEKEEAYRTFESIYKMISNPVDVIPVPEGRRLAPPTDTGLKNLSPDCYLVGIGHYDDVEHKLTIDKHFYSLLSSNSARAAFWVHETVWWLARRVPGGVNLNSGDYSKKLDEKLTELEQSVAQWMKPIKTNLSFNALTAFAIEYIDRRGNQDFETSTRMRRLVGNVFATNGITLSFANWKNLKYRPSFDTNRIVGTFPFAMTTVFMFEDNPSRFHLREDLEIVVRNDWQRKLSHLLSRSPDTARAISLGWLKLMETFDHPCDLEFKNVPTALDIPLPGYETQEHFEKFDGLTKDECLKKAVDVIKSTPLKFIHTADFKNWSWDPTTVCEIGYRELVK